MSCWTVQSGDILDEPADVLVCSANVFLNLSGGVGGALLLRYGPEMQRELYAYLARSGRRFASRGELVVMPPCGTPYKAVIHAVAVDGFYESSVTVVRDLVEASLALAATLGARRVALSALATGYGRMSMRNFAGAIGPLVGREWPPIEEVVIRVGNQCGFQTLRDAIGGAGLAPFRS